MLIKSWILIGFVVVVVQQLVANSLFFVGMSSSTAPLDIDHATLHATNNISDRNRLLRRVERWNETSMTSSLRLPAFDDLGQFGAASRLSTNWTLLESMEKVSRLQLKSNDCFPVRPLSTSVQCLPSLYIVGFEKCGTTVLNIWLSYHPNLRSHWLESRFFDENPKSLFDDFDNRWKDYVSSLPKLSSGEVGKVWTAEKSPAYALNLWAPKFLSELVPDARCLFVTRNPTTRAYSMFLMYTQHYPTVTAAVQRQPLSFFVKNLRTGDVRCVNDGYRDKQYANGRMDIPPGPGGSKVPLNVAPNEDEWVYLSYPPDPKDFDSFVRYAISNHKALYVAKPYTRDRRILNGGLYSAYLEKWAEHLNPENLIVVPSEDFFQGNQTLSSLDKLQELLGLPAFDFQEITTKDPETERYEIPSSLATRLNNVWNSYSGDSLPMLPETKELLDEFYCESNKKLSMLLGNRRLPGYACADESEMVAVTVV